MKVEIEIQEGLIDLYYEFMSRRSETPIEELKEKGYSFEEHAGAELQEVLINRMLELEEYQKENQQEKKTAYYFTERRKELLDKFNLK